MKYSVKQALKAAVSMLIIVGSAVQIFAEERTVVSPGIGFQQDEQEWDQLSLAEQYLFRLAKTSKVRRRVGGGVNRRRRRPLSWHRTRINLLAHDLGGATQESTR